MVAVEEPITDTQRLEWLLGHGHEFDYDVVDHQITRWYVKWYSDNKHHLAYGKDQRECIDNALRGEVKSF